MRTTTYRSILAVPAALLLATLALPAPALAQREEPTTPPQVGVGGPAVLPAGYQNVRWGIAAIPLQLIRGTMERRAHPDPHIDYLIELPPPGQRADIAHYKIWDDQLLEVHIYFDGTFNRKEGAQLLARFKEKYGDDPRHEVLKRGLLRSGDTRDMPYEERWIWEDPFTVQMLLRDVDENTWSCYRQSKVLEERRLIQERRELDDIRSQKVQDVKLD